MPMTKMYHSISGQIVGDTINSQTRSYLGDGFGNVVGTTNPDSTLQMWFVYRPYGSTASVTGTGIEPVVRWGGSRRMLVVDESNAEYGDARGGSYSVGEGQLTNGNYGEYELPGFPRDWNPLKRGEMPRITPMPPYKKPPRKSPPPVELPSVPTPAPADRGLLPGNPDAKELVAKLKFFVCMGCCVRKVIGGGPFMPFVDWIGDVINVPKLECTGSDRYEIGKAEGVPSIGNMDDFVEEFCKQLGIPEILCRPAPLPGGQEEWIPGPVKDFIDKLNKGINACNKLTCFIECGLQLKEGLDQAHIPDPWQVCGRESDEESCITCCAEKLGARAIHPVFKECERQCSLHYY